MPSKERQRREKRKQKYLENLSTSKEKEFNREEEQTIGQNNNFNARQVNDINFQCDITNNDINTILNPSGYLEDIHMDNYFSLLRNISHYRPQPTYYSQIPERITAIPEGTKHVQILYLGSSGIGVGHWICSFYNGATLIIYDSFNTKQLHPDAKIYLDKLYPFHPPIIYSQVQQQNNSYDCGLFAMAFCTSILYNRNPEDELYDISKLRSHAAEIFKSKTITLFPTKNRQVQLNQNYIKRKFDETEENKQERLKENKKYKQKYLENEISTKKEQRLENLRSNTRNYNKEENSENRNKRLENLRTNTRNYIKEETSEIRNKRLENLSMNFQNYISKETPNKKKDRVEINKSNNRKYVQNKKNHKISYKQALKGIGDIVEPHNLGPMNVLCQFCSSKNFKFEKPTDGKFTHCCRKDKLVPDKMKQYPEYLQKLLTGNDANSKNFKENIRKFNSALAFASMGAQISPPPGRGPYVFRIHGQIYHSTSSLYPNNGASEKYAQLYMIDTAEALTKRLNNENNKKCNATIMENLDILIRQINPYYQAYMMLKELEELEITKAKQNNGNIPVINLWLCANRNQDKRRYNIPTSNEVAVVFSSNDGEPPVNRDICIHPRGQSSIRINQYSENCDPMIYPVLFPHGDAGWGIHLKQIDGKKKISPLQFYMNRLADREYFNPCLHAGKLTQQYIVDAYVKIESERLTYIRQNQTKLRVELYSGLMDHVNNLAANEGAKPGTMIILPSTFQGGSRFMQKMYQNAMAIVREFGKPDLFVTVTCNPKWPEIINELKEGQTASDRPDIVSRVFYGKIKNMLHEFINEDIFGQITAYIYVIEFQKRGLPHMHLLLTLNNNDKIRNKDEIDTIVCAEIPDENTEPELFQIIKTQMIHGPCGFFNKNSPCMNDNKCSKKYPKDFRNETCENVNGYPLYRRRDNNRKIEILWSNGTVKYTVDNRWIVPYNPYLCKKYKAHINVEICSSIKSIKYICDYLCKGHDCASVKLGQLDKSKTVHWDEINGYLDARYVSAPECCWRMLEYPLHDKSHTVFELAVHLQNQQAVVFAPGQEKKAVERAGNRNTTLTAWFQLNQTDVNARQYHYMEIPKYYVFTNDNIWKPRQKTVKPPIGRIISVTPKDIERFHLRLLLIHTQGATSYNDIKTVDGTIYKTFQEAARAKGLLVNDDECEKCLQEAVLDKFPKQLRELFAYLICFNTTCDAVSLWEKFKDDLIEDYLRHHPRKNSENKGLLDIQVIIKLQGFELKDFGLPEPTEIDSDIYIDEAIDIDAEKLEGENNSALLNTKQREILELIMNAINDPNCKNRYFFVDGPGGTGKTFLYNTVISILRGQGLIVIPVAWTGIAATLLKGGKTAHSTFKLPVPINETSVCKIKGNSIAGKLLIQASLIIWDEITMAPKYALRAVDLILQDLMDNKLTFGGKTVVIGGDFRQCLPIIKYTNHRTAIIEISILRSTLWHSFNKQSLTQNMRVNKNEQEFCEILLKVGNGIEDEVTIPKKCLAINSLADEIFGTDIIKPENITDYINRAILSPKNEDTMWLNDNVLDKISGPTKIYYSADSAECDDNNKMNYPTELLNKQTPTGMPPHKLSLKVGAIVMLLRNLNPKRGLCNGTRLIVKNMKQNYLDLEVVTGQSKGNRIFLPRIDLKPTDSNLPFILKRRQFPIRLAFSMTINKSQGQTFDYVGINLEKPVFTHGQLYVAMSRVRSFDNLKIKLPDDAINTNGEGKTLNIVFKEIL